MELKANATLQNGRYVIATCIGHGGFGITYLAMDNRLGRQVVLKEYFPSYMVKRDVENSNQVTAIGPNFIEELQKGITKFLSEAKTLALLDEIQEIATVHDFFQENGTAYIVMEYIKGQNLKQIIRARTQPFSLEEAIELIRPCLVALDRVHQSGLIHRDFTPDNIIINEKGEPKIIDFGSSRDYVANEATMTIMVKHGYAPVEQYSNGVKQGTYTDVYSISAIIYEMITLQKPAASIERFMNDPVVVPSAINPIITSNQDEVIMRGLAVNYENRFMTIRALLNAISSVTNNYTQAPINTISQYTNQSQTQPVYNSYIATSASQQMQGNGIQAGIGESTEFVGTQGGYNPTGITGNNNNSLATELVGNTTNGNMAGYVQNSVTPVVKPITEKKKSKKGLIIGIVAAVLVMLIGIGVIASSGGSSKSDSSVAKVEDDGYDTSNKKDDDSDLSESSPASSDTAAAVSPSNKDDGMKVGVSMPTKDLQRWNMDGQNLKAGLESNGVEVDLQYAGNDVSTQISQIENMINSGCDVLIIAAIEGSSLSSLVDKAKEYGISVISYDRLIMNTDGVSYYTTFDNYYVGTLQGEYIEKELKLSLGRGPFNMEIFAGDAGDNNAAYFYAGAMDVLQKYINNGQLVVRSGQTSFASTATPAWATENAESRMEDIIASYYGDGNELHALLCSNDSTAQGSMDAVYNAGITWPLVSTGQDCDKINVKNIIAGYQSMSVFKDTKVLSDQTVKMTMQILNGETVDVNDKSTYNNGKGVVSSYLCAATVVTADNYKEKLIDSGYYTESDLSN